MSTVTQLTTIKANILAQIEDITQNPKPNYSIDGQSVSWQNHLDSLWAKLKEINDMIAAEEGPIEEVSLGCT